MPRHRQALGLAAAWLLAAASAQAGDAVAALREFVASAKTGRADFTQTVTSPDGARKKVSSGRFEFARPDRFAFSYQRPFEQRIVADGRKVWLYDVDLKQVTVRAAAQALGATPAALLTGNGLEREFELSAQPSRDGLDWVEALPKNKDAASVAALRIGFQGANLAALEITDLFGQRSALRFTGLAINLKLADDSFKFTPPLGVDVIEQ